MISASLSLSLPRLGWKSTSTPRSLKICTAAGDRASEMRTLGFDMGVIRYWSNLLRIVTRERKCEACLRTRDPQLHLLMDGRVKPGHDRDEMNELKPLSAALPWSRQRPSR